MIATTAQPAICIQSGCLYSPSRVEFLEAIKMIESPTGRINPFTVPAKTSSFTGLPRSKKIAVEMSMKPMTT